MLKNWFVPITSLSLAVSVMAALPSALAQTNCTILKSFGSLGTGTEPLGPLLDGQDGVLFGTTFAGGASNLGVVFKINPDGSAFTDLHSFDGIGGSDPSDGPILGTDGYLYGTTSSGGISNLGTVFRIAKDGSGFAVLHSFTGGSDSANPPASVIQGRDGALYGTTYYGNSSTRGTIFRLNTNGTGYSVIHSFTGNPDGQQPYSRLLEGSDGALYGTTVLGGLSNAGTVFSLNKDGTGYGVLRNFQAPFDGGGPEGGLIEGSDGALYGTTYNGGAENAGAIFTINKDGSNFSILRSFATSAGDGELPIGQVIEGMDGALYGQTYIGGSANGGTVFKINKDGSNYGILKNFLGGNGDGGAPRGIIQVGSGVFYGTTSFGGDTGAAGCIFALSSAPLGARVAAFSASSASNLVHFSATSFAQYDVQRSTNLVSWSVLMTLVAGTNGQFHYADLSPPQPSAFYRATPH